jgi:hypothetical protein
MSNYYKVLVRHLQEHLLKVSGRVSRSVSEQDPEATHIVGRTSHDAYNTIALGHNS